MITVTYQMSSRLVGLGYADDSPPIRRDLQVVRDFHQRPALTDEEAVEALREWMARPFVKAQLEIVRITKVTRTTEYEDVTSLKDSLDTPSHL